MVERIAVPTPFGVGPVNTYLAGRTLVDPGPATASAREALDDGLEERGLSTADLETVVLTHPHPDHFGLASELRDAGADVVATQRAAPILGQFDDRLAYEQAYFAALLPLHGIDPDTAETVAELTEALLDIAPPTGVDRAVAAGDVVALGEREATVREPAGHAVGELALAFETGAQSAGDDGTATSEPDAPERHAIVGDQVLPDTTPNPLLQPPEPVELEAASDGTVDETDDRDADDLSADDLDADEPVPSDLGIVDEHSPSELDALRPRVLPAYEDSLADLREADFARILPGHGEPIDDPAGRIDAIRAAHRERSDDVREQVADGPTSAADVMHGLFEDLPVTEYFGGVSEALGHLDLLERDGEVVQRERDGQLVYELA